MTDAGFETVRLSGSLSIRDVARIRQDLQAALAASSVGLTIDCSGLTGVDIAILQLLVAATRSAAAEGKSLRLAGASTGPLHTLLQQAGFVGPDGKPKAPHSSFWAGAETSEAA